MVSRHAAENRRPDGNDPRTSAPADRAEQRCGRAGCAVEAAIVAKWGTIRPRSSDDGVTAVLSASRSNGASRRPSSIPTAAPDPLRPPGDLEAGSCWRDWVGLLTNGKRRKDSRTVAHHLETRAPTLTTMLASSCEDRLLAAVQEERHARSRRTRKRSTGLAETGLIAGRSTSSITHDEQRVREPPPPHHRHSAADLEATSVRVGAIAVPIVRPD